MAEQDVTRLLTEWSEGDPSALDRLLPLVYADLRRLAARQLRAERPDHTLSATAVVHEAYLRLVGQRQVRLEERAQIFAAASTQMRCILVDHARRRSAGKRGGPELRVTLDEEVAAGMERDLDLLALDQA